MNEKLAKLLRQYCKHFHNEYRPLKRAVKIMTTKQRVAFKKHLQEYIV